MSGWINAALSAGLKCFDGVLAAERRRAAPSGAERLMKSCRVGGGRTETRAAAEPGLGFFFLLRFHFLKLPEAKTCLTGRHFPRRCRGEAPGRVVKESCCCHVGSKSQLLKKKKCFTRRFRWEESQSLFFFVFFPAVWLNTGDTRRECWWDFHGIDVVHLDFGGNTLQNLKCVWRSYHPPSELAVLLYTCLYKCTTNLQKISQKISAYLYIAFRDASEVHFIRSSVKTFEKRN